MTRQEFDDICYWGDLIDLAHDYGYDSVIEDIYYGESFHSLIDEEIAYKVQYDGWMDIRDWLNSIPDFDDEDFIRRDDYGEYYILDNNDFTYIKEELRDYFIDNDEFDDDDDDDSNDEGICEIEEEPEFEEGCPLDEMINSGVQIIRVPTSLEDEEKARELIQMMYV